MNERDNLITSILIRYRRKLSNEALQTLRQIYREEVVRASSIGIGTCILIGIIVLLLLTGLYLVRCYNLSHSYGTGGCLLPFLMSDDDCQVMA